MTSIRTLLVPGFLVAVMLSAAGALLGTTSATFTDRVVSSATVTAQTLPAPVEVTAQVASGSVTVSWQPGAGDFASGYQLFRQAGACAGWTPSGSPLASVASAGASTAHTYLDSTTTGSQTYCYAVRGTFAGWVSPFSAGAQVTTPAPPPTSTKLYLNGSASGVLQPTAGSGTVQFNPPSTTRLYVSTTTREFTSAAGWKLSLDLSDLQPSSQTVRFKADLWYASGTCGTLASATTNGRLIASSAATDISTTGVVEIALAGTSGFVAPAGAQTLCLQVVGSNFSMTQQTHFHYTLSYGAATWLEGPIAP